MLEPVGQQRRAAAQELADEHRHRGVDVRVARYREPLVGEARQGDVGPRAVVARDLRPAAHGERVEVLRLDDRPQRDVEPVAPVVRLRREVREGVLHGAVLDDGRLVGARGAAQELAQAHGFDDRGERLR